MIQDMQEISDGKIYGVNDMVRAACNNCEGCHACCEGMGDSILLDPLDTYRLMKGFNCIFEQLLASSVELHVEEGLIVPNLKMNDKLQQCYFLNENGRCSIHDFRPGLCRVFPLGRMYEEKGVSYFLQSNACKKEGRTKVKVGKWIDTPKLKEYHQFLLDWHGFKKTLERYITETKDENEAKKINLFVLNQFYIRPYDLSADFYVQYYDRMQQARQVIIEN